ncbi:MAG: TlpA family protein disulfide reductase [Flavobacteriales bacterium]|nr:TlpA family protein disulfide reductase [Flavobacteriales bacterium]
MHLELGEAELPFQFDVLERDSGGWHMRIHNAAEEIDVSEIESRGDSLFVRMPLFDSEFQARLLNDTIIEGVWCNLLKGPEYRIPFRAWHTAAPRFDHEAPRAHVSGSWRSVFSAGAPEAYEAIGIFEQFDDGRVHGTFMTETGDYRFLEGAVSGDSLMLSAFDGSHAFLFHARVLGDSMAGRFWSGTHWQEPWHAARDEQYRLRDPDSLTTLQPGTQAITFTFPDLDGHPWSSTDPDLKGLPLIVHVMGSWCPNCVDETRLLKEMHQKYQSRGLRIVAIGFEKQQDSTAAIAALRRFKERLDVPYPVLLGGPAAKEQAAARLPFLNHLISYPTCIFIDRAGHVRRIRTGFNGPGTGEHYAAYRADLESFLDTLVMR